MLKFLRNTGLSILVLSCLAGCEEESTYKDFVEPALKRGLEFGYLYRDMEPSNAGVLIHSETSEEDALPRAEFSIRLSSLDKGDYPLADNFRVRDIGENTNFSEVRIETQYEDNSEAPERSKLKVVNGSILLQDHAPGRGEWSTDGTPIDLTVQLTVNRKRFTPLKCKSNDDKSKNVVTVECSCVNSLREKESCQHSGPQQQAYTQNFEAICCDSLGLFEEQNELLKFETRAHFKADLCTSVQRNRAEARFCK